MHVCPILLGKVISLILITLCSESSTVFCVENEATDDDGVLYVILIVKAETLYTRVFICASSVYMDHLICNSLISTHNLILVRKLM